jgi:predicted RNase H-like HicB family nuclease
MRFAIIIEKGPTNYGAYAPDVPGCGAVGDTPDEARRNLRGALEAHLRLMREDGDALPEPASSVEYLDVDIPGAAAARRAPRRAKRPA